MKTMLKETMDIFLEDFANAPENEGKRQHVFIFTHGFKNHGEAVDYLKALTGGAGRQGRTSTTVWHEAKTKDDDLIFEVTAFVNGSDLL